MHENSDLQSILGILCEQHAIDFSLYKPGSLKRRINLRLLATGILDYAAYRRYLAEHPEEIDLLLAALTITVSHFFRNPLVFEVLRELVIPELIECAPIGGLRIWCAGCARGEEAYSLAILMREICVREAADFPISILATDIDEAALAFAEQGCYQEEALAEVKKRYLDSCFRAEGDTYRVREDIRAVTNFARHDLTTCQPPRAGIFFDYQLIFCRNTLIYFNRDLSDRVVGFLARGLAPGGYLVLGEAETIPTDLSRQFREIIPHTRIYRKEDIQ